MNKLNLAKVRSAATGLTIALALSLLAAPGASAKPYREVMVRWLPPQTTVAEIAHAGFSPGLMSAGLGTVPPGQTYLDVGQGNRVFDSLYDESLPPVPSGEERFPCDRWFQAAVVRAAAAPAEIEPDLLGREVGAHGPAVYKSGASACAFGGRRGYLGGIHGHPDGLLEIRNSSLESAESSITGLEGGVTVIAIARPTGESDAPLAIGIAGGGFDGNLTSDTTRTDGYVLSTDVAPTILERFGIAIPSAMSGQPIRSEGSVDVGVIESLGARMAVVSHRRGPVIGIPAIAWILLTLLIALASRGALARPAVRVLGLSVVYLPLVLLAGAALEPAQTPEVVLVGLGCPLLGAVTLALLGGYRALAAAAGLTIFAYAVDVVAGSPLTSLSLLGPNPGLGVRFYGIGNELEALLGVLVVAGTGAALAGFGPRLSPERCAAAFLVFGLLCAVLFAAGDFGADVGAAIVFPVGAAVAAAVIAAGGRRWVPAVIVVPCVVLGLLALIDLVTGANSHFTRSVLDAGGLHSLGDVAQRRLELSAKSFARPVLLALLPLVVVLAVLTWVRRDQLGGWLAGAPAMRAGMIGALAATLVGTLANDSGALLLEIGAAYLLVFVGFAWTESRADAVTTSSH